MDIVSCDKQGINHILESYENGKIIAFPTDTIYGIGCDPFNKDSVSRIYDLKKREGQKKFPILGFSKIELEKIVEFSSNAERISSEFWPGQVTLVLPIKKNITKIIGTSANISGEKSIIDSNELKKRLPNIDVLVDGGKIVSLGESTIIEFVDDKLKIIREGSVSKHEIESALWIL